MRGPRFLEPNGPQVVLFGGKGGVGKTTCAAAAALSLAAARPDRRFLVISTDPAHSLRDCLGGPLPANLELLQIDADAALRAFKEKHGETLRELAVRGTFLADSEVAPMLDLSLPGMDELMAFLEVSRVLEAGGHHRVVIDTAPMGHTLRLLELFEVMTRWARALDTLLAKHRFMVEHFSGTYQPDQVDHFLLDLEQSVKKLANLFHDASRCLFVPVLLPEHLSLLQTVRLLDELTRLGIPTSDLVVNRVCPASPGCPVCQAEAASQRSALEQVCWQFSDRPQWTLPLVGWLRGPALPERRDKSGPSLAGLWDRAEPLRVKALPPTTLEPPPPRVRATLELPAPNLRLLLVAGKGGVGKTTVACATALHLAEVYPHRRVILFSTDPAHSLSACLDVPVGPHEVKVRPNLTAIEVDAAADFDLLKQRYADELAHFFDGLSGRHAVGMEFDREALERLFDLSPPGLDEVMALTRIIDLMQADRHDLFVLDTAPSGHLIRLLALPRLAQDWLRIVFTLLLKYRNVFRLPRTTNLLVDLSRGLKALQQILSDPFRGQLLAVSIPTELSLARTVELLDACRSAGLSVRQMVINQLRPSGKCHLCRQLAEQEGALCRRFDTAFGHLRPGRVERGFEPRGLIRLLELGRALYRKE